MTTVTDWIDATDPGGLPVRIARRGNLVPSVPWGEPTPATSSFGAITYHLEDGTQLGIAGPRQWQHPDTGVLYSQRV